jgi:hypothetical protein
MDNELGMDKCRAIHIDNERSESVGFGYVRDVHELQSFIQSTTKMFLSADNLIEKENVEVD